MKFNKINVLFFFHFAAAKTTHANGISLRKTLTGDNIGYHADAGFSKDAHVKGQGPTSYSSSSIAAASVVKNLGGTPSDAMVSTTSILDIKGSRSSDTDELEVRMLEGHVDPDQYFANDHPQNPGDSFFRSIGEIKDANLYETGLSLSGNDDLSIIAIANYKGTGFEGPYFPVVTLLQLDVGNNVYNPAGTIEDNNVVQAIFAKDAKVEVEVSGDGSKVAIAQVYTNRRDDKKQYFSGEIKDDSCPAGTVKVDTVADCFSAAAVADGEEVCFNQATSVNESSFPDQFRSVCKVPDSNVKIYQKPSGDLDSNSEWTLASTPHVSNAGGGGHHPGIKLSLNEDGSRLLIGERYDSNGSGQVTLYDLSMQSVLKTIPGAGDDKAGSSVMLSRNGSCFIYGATGKYSSKGEAYVYCLEASTWLLKHTLNSTSSADTKQDFGFSVAINSDAKYVAVGARFHDYDTKENNGVVMVFNISGDSASQVGNTISGERGESDPSNNLYYVGDEFGFSLALSDTLADGTIRVAIGGPKNDNSATGYYNGHVELHEISASASSSDTWTAIGYDLDGSTEREKAGFSLAFSKDGNILAVGSPGYGDVSDGVGRGVVRVYEQLEYSSSPSLSPSSIPSDSSKPSQIPSVSMSPSTAPSESQVPSLIPSLSSQPSDGPSVSIAPSTNPSVSVKPSNIPSLSLVPSTTPSLSSQPSDGPSVSIAPSTNTSVSVKPSSKPTLSLVPSTTPSLSSQPSDGPSLSIAPSSLPSAEVDKEFQLISTYGPFREDTKDWCLTAFEYTSKLHVRPCRSYDSSQDQLWKFTAAAVPIPMMFPLSILPFRMEVSHTPKTRKFGKLVSILRVDLNGSLNEVLDKWEIRYIFEFPSAAPTSATPPLQFSTSFRHACALFSTEVKCIGQNKDGERGLYSGDLTYPNPLSVSSSSSTIEKVVTGVYFTCMLMTDGSVYCNGDNYYGQLGNGETTNYGEDNPSPVQVKKEDSSFLTDVKDISAGYNHVCAIYGTDDKIYCWGWNKYNQLGFNGSPGVKAVVATSVSTCLVTKSTPSKVECKGLYLNDKIFDMGQTITKLTAGQQYVCALLEDQTAKCFGGNGYGQLGNGSTTSNYDSASHVLVKDSTTPLSNITDINAGYESTCLLANSIPMCFGYNGYYQLGIANGGASVLYPTELTVKLPDGVEVVSAHVNQVNGYAVMSDDSVYSWGNNALGGLGQGDVAISGNIGDTDEESAVKVAFGEWGS